MCLNVRMRKKQKNKIKKKVIVEVGRAVCTNGSGQRVWLGNECFEFDAC